jgi:hypothetical protein
LPQTPAIEQDDRATTTTAKIKTKFKIKIKN